METESVSKLDGNVQRGSLLASFPRDFPRENEEGNRGRVGTSTLGERKRAFLGRLDEEKRTERDRGEEVEKAVEPCWKLLKSARARDGSGSEGRNERKGGRTERIV